MGSSPVAGVRRVYRPAAVAASGGRPPLAAPTGVDAQTARHSLDAKKAFDGSAVLRAVQVALREAAE